MSKETSSSLFLYSEITALKERTIKVEDTFYEIAAGYSRLPWSARTNLRLANGFRETLFALFSEVDKGAHAQFFEGVLNQAKFVVENLTDLDSWVERKKGLVRRVKVGSYEPIDTELAKQSIGVASEGLVVVEKRLCVLRGDLRIMLEAEGKEDEDYSEQSFMEQSPEDVEKCLGAARRLLILLPKTREQLRLGKGAEEVCNAFLGFAEMVRGKEEEGENEEEGEEDENRVRASVVCAEKVDGQVVEIMEKESDCDGDSGICVEKVETNSNSSPKRC